MAPILSPTTHPEDEQLVLQLASLQAMHDQIYHLRTLPQALVKPLSEMLRIQTLPSSGSDTPSRLYAAIQKTAIEGLKDVEDFKQSWLSDESQALWARTLHEPCPQGTSVWRINYISKVKEGKAQQSLRASNLEIPAVDSNGFKDIIHGFHEKHPLMKIKFQDTTEFTPFNIRIAGMTFRVASSGDGGQRNYEAQYNQDSKVTQLQDGILRHLNQRPAKGNLGYLLDMIASYEDVKRRPCDKCLKLFDKKLRFPVIRNQKPNPSRDPKTDIEWEAVHADCT